MNIYSLLRQGTDERVRAVFSEPKFFWCKDNQIVLPMAPRCALDARDNSAVSPPFPKHYELGRGDCFIIMYCTFNQRLLRKFIFVGPTSSKRM